MIDENIKNSFPEKDNASRKTIRREYYRHLSKIVIESLKGFAFSKNEAVFRLAVLNPEILKEFYNKGKDIVILGAHYNNWEWGTLSMPPQLTHEVIIVYKELSNSSIDGWLKEKREKTGAKLSSLKDVLVNRQTVENPRCYIFLADQGPVNMKRALWTNFLNQRTACSGYIEMIAQKINGPVFYSKVEQIAKHRYTVEFVPLIAEPRKVQPGDLIQRYMQELEKQINRDPVRWLWSHNRWKRSRDTD